MGLILFVLIDVSGLSYYSTSEREHHPVFPRVLNSLSSLLPLSMFQSLLVFILYITSMVLLSGSNREKYLYPIFPEVNILRGYIFIIPLVSPTVPNAYAKCQALLGKKIYLGNNC